MPSQNDVPNRSSLSEGLAIDLSRLDEFNPTHTEVEIEVELALVQVPDCVQFGAESTIVSFDQSIANTGYVVLRPDDIDGIEIITMGVFNTTASPDMMQWENTLHRSTQLFAFVVDLLREHNPTLVLHETPPVGHSRMFNTESSIVTATVVRNVAATLAMPVQMVSANRVKKHLTGNRNAKKKEVRQALEKRFEVQLKTPGLRKNEHTFDALGIAITYLEEER